MEGSSTNIEEMKITDQRTPTFYLYHPCFLLEELVGALFKCLGFEIGTKTKEEEEKEEHVVKVKPPSVLEDDSIFEEITPTNEHESSQSSSEQQECSITTQHFEFSRNLFIRRRGPRRPDLSSGSSPGHN